jgi:hypothetical protein
MKFLLIVFALHVIGKLISKKRNDGCVEEPGVTNENVPHPAEYDLR